MDFHSLTRRELQALCKKNKIPANLTNVAMADALQSLDFVDGIEEILSSCESETANSSMESPGKSEIITSVPRTCRRATQQKAIKHDPETLQTLTRSRCRTRGKVVRDVDEAKNDMHETPALPTTRGRAAATSIRSKLESAMKECEPKEKIGDQIEGEMKDVPKTPAVVLTSQRKESKASSVRQMYSTRQSARIAGKPMQESTQENEMSGTLTFDAFPEETEEGLEVDSEQYSIHKNEVDKNGQYSNTSVQNEIETEDVVQQESYNNLVVASKAEEDSEEVPLGHNNNGAKIEVFGEESMEESEIDQDQAKTEKDFQNKSQNLGEDSKRSFDITNVILMKQPHEEDKPHCDDTSDFVAENDGEEEDHVNHTDVAGKEELMEEPASVNPDTNTDIHEVNPLGQLKDASEAKVSGSQLCLKDASEANMEDAGEEEPMEEYEVDHADTNVDSAAHGPKVAQEEEPMEEFDVDQAEANVDSEADALEVAGEEESMEESEVDYAEANVDNAAHGLPPLASLTPDDDAQEGGSQQCLHVSEVVAGEETMEESEIDHAAINVDIAAHALPPLASLIPNAVPEPVYKGIAGNDSKQCLQDLSLRKLTKMLKEIQITKDPSGKEVAKIKAPSSRSALQALPENRLISDTEN